MTPPEMSVIFVHLETGRKIRGYTVEQMLLWGKACAAAEREACARQWVGLTKVQQDDFADAYGSYEAVCAIEAKLKDKNT